MTTSTATAASTGRTITWGKVLEYDQGVTPSVALDDQGDVFEAHQSASLFSAALWYTVGKVSAGNINWGKSMDYDTGYLPRISCFQFRQALEVHAAGGEGSYGLWYRFGYILLDRDPPHIGWSASVNYSSGKAPAAAICSLGAVEIHEAEFDHVLWYKVGVPDFATQRIDWGPSHKHGEGQGASIAINEAGVVVEVHESPSRDTMWCRVGQVDVNSKTISWGDSIRYDEGFDPDIALNDAGVAVEVHRSQNKFTLWYHVGQVDAQSKTITWGDSQKYDDGVNPKIAVNNNGVVVEVHGTEKSDKTGLFSRVGKIV